MITVIFDRQKGRFPWLFQIDLIRSNLTIEKSKKSVYRYWYRFLNDIWSSTFSSSLLLFLSSLYSSLCLSPFSLIYKRVLYVKWRHFWIYWVVNKHHSEGNSKATPPICRYNSLLHLKNLDVNGWLIKQMMTARTT